MSMSKQKGITLIELMIVIVVVAILASIALPSYQQHMQKGRRADGKNMLMELAALQERFYSENGFYGDMNDLVNAANIDSDQGHYNIVVNCNPDSANCLAADRPQFYQFTAAAQGVQVGDTDCGDYTIDEAGLVTETGARDVDYCW